MSYTHEDIVRALDLAVLKPDATLREVAAGAELVQLTGIASLCVAPSNVKLARRYTERVCAVVGFPHGNTYPSVKFHEAAMAIGFGACELDVVVNIGRLREAVIYPVEKELAMLVGLAHKHNALIKVILEVCYLQDMLIREGCRLAVKHGADFVKTSTGFGTGNATPEAVKIMLDAVQGRAQVKASGGIKTYADAARYLDLGCTRLGSSKFKELLP